MKLPRCNYKKIFILLVLISMLFIVFINNKLLTYSCFKDNNSEINEPIIIWWTKLLDEYDEIKECGEFKCRFTVSKKLFNDPQVKGFVFYGSDIKKSNFPLPRRKTDLWALYHEESPKNIPFISHELVLQHFNFTSTFSRYSDHPLTTQYINNLLLLRTQKYLVPISKKNELRKRHKLASTVYVQSICNTITKRDQYIKELMKYIEIDSYGECLHNRDIPDFLSENYLTKLYSEEFFKFLARYKFIVAIENGVCNDYITEKFWRPLIVGSVPIYFGSPTIRDWMPNNKSAILITDFDSPKKLAKFLKKLDKNDSLYNEYLGHKYLHTGAITNKKLKKVLLEKNSDDASFEYFECFICEKIHENNIYEKISMAKQSHYDCEIPVDHKLNVIEGTEKNYWNTISQNGRCEADLINRFLIKNKNYTEIEFNQQMEIDIKNGRCKL